jgi:DNA-binding beta-propeller fold protein YncE
MKTVLKIWFLVVILYGAGVASVMFAIWPATALVDIYQYITNNGYETRSVGERVRSDLDITPYRLLTRDGGGAARDAKFTRMKVANLRERRAQPQVFVSPARKPQLTFIYGVFDFTDGLHGAILLDENGKVIRRWTLNENPENLTAKPNTRLYPHGVLVDPDGSVTFIFDFGTSITKVDACGRYVWSKAERRDYNHVLSRSIDGNIWAPGGPPNWFDEIDPKSGEIIRSISMGDIIKANPDIGIFSPRAEFSSTGRIWPADPFHINDIEALQPKMAAAFPMLDAGDLMISFRALSLIFIIDPNSLKVKWWRQGAVQQQHDPDFEPDGTIMVLDNRWDNPPSRVVKIDPATYDVRMVLDGSKYDFNTINRGKIQQFGGDLLVTSSKQGRVFEVDETGRLVFDFVNTYDDKEGLRGLVSEAIALPMDYFKELPTCN